MKTKFLILALIVPLTLFSQERYSYRYGINNADATYYIRGLLYQQYHIKWSIYSTPYTDNIDPATGKKRQVTNVDELELFEVYKDSYVNVTRDQRGSDPIYFKDIPAGMYTIGFTRWYNQFEIQGTPQWFGGRAFVEKISNESKYININIQ